MSGVGGLLPVEPERVYTGPGNPTHGIASTYRSQIYACRCQPCRDANASLQAREDARRTERLSSDASLVEHSSGSTYTNWGCRCDSCKKAHRNEMRAAYESRCRRLKADPDCRPHGNLSTYSAWGCRCEPCKAAKATAARKAAS